MSEGPIKAERLATTASPIPRIRKDDEVHIAETHLWPATTRWRVLETDGAIATLMNPRGQKIRRYCRTLRKAAP